jgi:hypothetical protein
MSVIWIDSGRPVATADPFFANVPLLLPGTGSNGSTIIADLSGTPKAVTVNGSVAISTAQSRFGGGSILFNGGYLTVADPSLAIGGNEFTKEGWFFPVTIQPGFRTLWAHRSTQGGFGGALLVSNNGNLEYFTANSTASGWQIAGASTGLSLTAGEWQFLRMVRSGNTITASKNNVAGASVTVSGVIGTTGSFSICAGSATGSQEVNAYVNEFRVTIPGARPIELPNAPFPRS